MRIFGGDILSGATRDVTTVAMVRKFNRRALGYMLTYLALEGDGGVDMTNAI